MENKVITITLFVKLMSQGYKALKMNILNKAFRKMAGALSIAAGLVFVAFVPTGETLADPPQGGEPTALAISINNMRTNVPPRPVKAPPGANWWLYDLELKETSGQTGITLTSWRKCYLSPVPIKTRCEPWKDNIKELYGTDYIPKGGSISILKSAWIWAEKTGYEYTITGTYRGRDDTGKKVEAGYKFSIISE